MFSHRLPGSLEPTPLARALAEAESSGRALLDLTVSNPTTVGIDYPDELVQALSDPGGRVYAPTPEGLPVARAAVAGYYARHGRSVDPGRVLLTASTSEGYAFAWKLLCDAGDRVLVPQPSYPLFEHLCRLDCVEPVPYPLVWDGGWSIDLDAVAARLDGRTRAIVVVHPHNPTGAFLTVAERDALAALAARAGVALVSDEVFLDYGFGPDPARAGSLVDVGDALTLVLSGLSKPAGLPQLKLGWMHVGGPPSLVAEARARLEVIADTYLSVSTPVQLAAPRLLRAVDTVGAAIAARARAARDQLAAALGGTAITPLRTDGGWAQILRLPRHDDPDPAHRWDDERWARVLLDDGVVVQPGYFFDLPPTLGATVVVSLLTPPDVLAEGLARLIARVESAFPA